MNDSFLSLFGAIVLLVGSTNSVKAEAMAPEGVVRQFVEAVQKGNATKNFKRDLESIANQTLHSYSLRELEELFGTIVGSKIKFEGLKVIKETGIVRLRMTHPVRLDFTLQHQNSVFRKASEKARLQILGKGDYYQILAISP